MIFKEGVVNDTQQWVVQVPVVITYQAGSQTAHRRDDAELLTELLAVRLTGAGLPGGAVAVTVAGLGAADAREADVALPARILARADDVRGGRM